MEEQNIKRFHIDAASTTTIITGIGVCDGLAVDWRASQLYWTDATHDTISVSDLNGNNPSLLISSDLDQPRAIALDLDNRYISTDYNFSITMLFSSNALVSVPQTPLLDSILFSEDLGVNVLGNIY